MLPKIARLRKDDRGKDSDKEKTKQDSNASIGRYSNRKITSSPEKLDDTKVKKLVASKLPNLSSLAKLSKADGVHLPRGALDGIVLGMRKSSPHGSPVQNSRKAKQRKSPVRVTSKITAEAPPRNPLIPLQPLLSPIVTLKAENSCQKTSWKPTLAPSNSPVHGATKHSPPKSAERSAATPRVSRNILGETPLTKISPLDGKGPKSIGKDEDHVFWMASPPVKKLRQFGSIVEDPQSEISDFVNLLEDSHRTKESPSSISNIWLRHGALGSVRGVKSPQVVIKPHVTPKLRSLKRSLSYDGCSPSPIVNNSAKRRKHWSTMEKMQFTNSKKEGVLKQSKLQELIGKVKQAFTHPQPGADGAVMGNGGLSRLSKCASESFLSGCLEPESDFGPDVFQDLMDRGDQMRGDGVHGDNMRAFLAGSNVKSRIDNDSFNRESVKGKSTLESLPLVTEDDFFFDDDDLFDEIAGSTELDQIINGFQSMKNEDVEVGVAVENSNEVEMQESEVFNEDTSHKFMRYLLLEVDDTFGEHGHQKRLRVLQEKTGRECVVFLRGVWLNSPVSIGDYMNVIGGKEQDGSYILDNTSRNLLILHPDILLSGTAISESFECQRRSVLNDRIRSLSTANAANVYGQLLHEVFQHCLLEMNFDNDVMDQFIRRLVEIKVNDIWAVGENEVTAVEHLKEYAIGMREWWNRYGSLEPLPDALVSEHRGDGMSKTTMSLHKVLGVEENIWSPMYGVKGKIDVGVQVKYRFGNNQQDAVDVAVPLEFKTGKSFGGAMHRAQTILYSLLMSDRYDVDVSSGILYYLKSAETIRIPAIPDEVRAIIMQRNEIACYFNIRDRLPPMKQDMRTCTRCFKLDGCVLYHKSVEKGTAESSGLGALFEQKTGHLTQTHTDFFEKWDKLIALEEGDLYRYRKEIWGMVALERENAGRCLSGMKVMGLPEENIASSSRGNRYEYTLAKLDPSFATSFLNFHLSVGDPILLSSERGHFALAIGFVTDLQPASIKVRVDRELQGLPRRLGGFHDRINQNFEGLTQLKPGKSASHRVERNFKHLVDKEFSYRIDKDEISTGMGLVRNNLMNLFTMDGDEKRRRLIVDLEPPIFTKSDFDVESIPNLNTDQKRAVDKVLSTTDYALILGMPGTGKTTTIASIISALVARGKSVFLTSYTHTAVDNLLLKLKDEKIDFVRIGSKDRVHPGIVEFTADSQDNLTTVQATEDYFNSKPVVATTCLGISHPIFLKRKFDYCIVDEASQITLPVCLGPLRFCDTFILVGDHYQLPPIVKSNTAKIMGLQVSLFKRLSEAHPEAVVNLEHQYRMNSDIMLLSNTLIYDYKLRCGTPQVADWVLDIPNIDGLEAAHRNLPAVPGRPCDWDRKCWLRDLLAPNRKVVFVDTDQVPALDVKLGELVQNQTEATLVYQTVEAFHSCGIQEEQIGVISPYRSQLKLIKNLLQSRTNIEIHTVDKYQGRDKDCILVSLVKSNLKGNIGDLLKDWRRINVAFTRARKKLIIFGSRSTLKSSNLFLTFFEMMENKQWIYELPPNAHQMHHFLCNKDQTTQNQDLPTNTSAFPTYTSAFPSFPTKVVLSQRLLDKHPIINDLLQHKRLPM